MLEIFKRSPKKELLAPISNISTLARQGNDLFSDTLILLDERLSGNLFCADKIVVEQNGVLSGNITSKLCVVSGTITGNIVSTDQMDIKSTAIIKGNIRSALINIEPGVVINGSVTIIDDGEAVTGLSKKIKEFSEKEYLRDRLHPELPQLNAEPVFAVKLNWDIKSADDLDALNLDKLKTDVQPGLELTELDWSVIDESERLKNDSDFIDKITLAFKPEIAIPKAEEKTVPVAEDVKIEESKPNALTAAPEKTTSVPQAKVEENNQRWW